MLIAMPAVQWSPHILFAAGEQGGWYDPSDISTLWQDSARTTPVTATGQTVGAIDDKSGRGNHLLQATAGRLPAYQIDGTGRPYLNFDGTDDRMQSGATFAAGSNAMQTFAGVNKITTGVSQLLWEFSPNASTNNGSCSVVLELAGTNSLTRSRGSAVQTADTASGASPAGLVVMGGQANIATPTVLHTRNLTTYGPNTASQGTGNYGTWGLNLAARNNGAIAVARMHLYGLIVRFGADLSPAGIALAERWMARKCGVSF